MKTIYFFLFILFLAGSVAAQETIPLVPLQMTGGMPIMEALAKRSTARAFDSRDLSDQQMSDLLWAAFGINRPDGKRTAPSARNYQETDIYVLLPQGVYIYDAEAHRLNRLMEGDIRELGGTQDFVKDAPVTLVLIADLTRINQGGTGDKLQTAYIDAGYISQNIYLYCTSEGLATGARGLIDRPALGDKLNLKETQAIIIAHSVGYHRE
ncbi:MAG: SagB/ThcOx family dehydrogenase [Bacteroidales bacterium]